MPLQPCTPVGFRRLIVLGNAVSALAKEFSGLSKRKNAALIVIPGVDLGTMKSFSNFGNITVDDVRNLNPVTILQAKYLIITDPKAAFATLSKKSVVKAAVTTQ